MVKPPNSSPSVRLWRPGTEHQFHAVSKEFKVISEKVNSEKLKQGQPNVCSKTEIVKTRKLQPVVKPAQKTKKVWKKDCPNGQRWCTEYKK